jgi:hypothetical protein
VSGRLLELPGKCGRLRVTSTPVNDLSRLPACNDQYVLLRCDLRHMSAV